MKITLVLLTIVLLNLVRKSTRRKVRENINDKFK